LAVDGRRGMQVQTQRRHGERRRGCGLRGRDQVRAGERELHAGAKRRVHVEVALVGGSEDLVDAREHSRHALRRRWGRGQEAHAAAALLEGAVRGEGVQVHVEAEVAAESLHHHEHTGVQRLHAAQVVALLHRPPHVVHHRPRQRTGDLRQQRPVVAQALGHRPAERQHPLPIAHRRQHVVDRPPRLEVLDATKADVVRRPPEVLALSVRELPLLRVPGPAQGDVLRRRPLGDVAGHVEQAVGAVAGRH
jgi:hypothetical protein